MQNALALSGWYVPGLQSSQSVDTLINIRPGSQRLQIALAEYPTVSLQNPIEQDLQARGETRLTPPYVYNGSIFPAGQEPHCGPIMSAHSHLEENEDVEGEKTEKMHLPRPEHWCSEGGVQRVRAK